MPELELVREGSRLVERFIQTQRQVNTREQALNRAVIEHSEAKKALAGWLAPKDPEPGERLVIPWKDAYLQFTYVDGGWDVRWRGGKLPRED